MQLTGTARGVLLAFFCFPSAHLPASHGHHREATVCREETVWRCMLVVEGIIAFIISSHLDLEMQNLSPGRLSDLAKVMGTSGGNGVGACSSRPQKCFPLLSLHPF